MLRFLAFLTLTACGSVDYDDAPVGRLSGTVLVMWVGETEAGEGDGRFVYVPSATPLRFERTNPSATLKTIQPEMMYTDGGSIPALAQVFKGFSPWGYAPAYIVHDWLFVARKCVNDNSANPDQAAVAQMPFGESATVAAEVIKTLIDTNTVAPNDVAPQLIASAVAGPIAKSRWDARGACARDKVTPAHVDMIRRALPAPPGARSAQPPGKGPVAQIVQVIDFGAP
ncbi:MAG: hypothetical protein U1A24_20230 [Cypionkella sp.]|uniref:hypothetical protein n=1 Tax=Cypionkella sp. TaxID=2811411 RepID=UPI002AB84DE9|nr:hypothetical protein [Cypionkella sp.]MDZ4312881.1 hypothetical protein [Cypionkella sp.]